jgi:hypothetical protein
MMMGIGMMMMGIGMIMGTRMVVGFGMRVEIGIKMCWRVSCNWFWQPRQVVSQAVLLHWSAQL